MIICYNVPAILASPVEYKYDGRPLSVTKLMLSHVKRSRVEVHQAQVG